MPAEGRAGNVVAQRYRLIEPLASGGMGTVWRAQHLELDIEVALKVLSSDVATPSGERRFKQEAQAAARLRHANVVQVLDFGVDSGQPYIVMELLRGEDLGQRLEREGPLGLDLAQHVIDGVAQALELAHDEGIVHRDLKPANVFLQKRRGDDVVKVLDFGIAKDAHAENPVQTTAASFIGSPAYMSPEQVLGDPVGPPADIWAMGVVAFETITGKNPFEDDKLVKVFDRVLRHPVPSPRELRPELPEALTAFFERAFARQPTDRFSSAETFAAAFRKATATHEGADPLPERLTAPADVPGKVQPRVALRVGVFAGLAAVAALVMWGAAERAPSLNPIQESGTAFPLAAHSDALANANNGPPSEAAAVSATPSARMPPSVVSALTDQASAAPAVTRSKRAKPSPATKPSAPALDPRFGIPIAD